MKHMYILIGVSLLCSVSKAEEVNEHVLKRFNHIFRAAFHEGVTYGVKHGKNRALHHGKKHITGLILSLRELVADSFDVEGSGLFDMPLCSSFLYGAQQGSMYGLRHGVSSGNKVMHEMLHQLHEQLELL